MFFRLLCLVLVLCLLRCGADERICLVLHLTYCAAETLAILRRR